MDMNEAHAEIFNIAEVLIGSEDIHSVNAYPEILSIRTSDTVHSFYPDGTHHKLSVEDL